ncbi:MAG: DUF1849 family protein [Alphaproteobacteria bacterium]|nr:DUF1849 family protein [Alphaproteobacteria bacterium]
MLELHQNGIAREMAVDYGDFTMLAHLKTLDVQPLPTCP